MHRIKHLIICATLGAALVLSACGDDGDGSAANEAAGAGATTAADAPARPSGDALTQKEAVAFRTGTPKPDVTAKAGKPLPIDEYALNADDRERCLYYAFRNGGKVDYDNVWRFCFAADKLESLSTAPSRRVAGPDAGAPSPKEPKELEPADPSTSGGFNR